MVIFALVQRRHRGEADFGTQIQLQIRKGSPDHQRPVPMFSIILLDNFCKISCKTSCNIQAGKS